MELQKLLQNLRKQGPLIHNITNYVTVNDVANLLLASGASPIMADDAGEVEEIVALCAGLHLNIGTLNERTVHSMFLAGRRANESGIPVLLDPVGAGASEFRTATAVRLLEELKPAAIRGNVSEIKTLALGSGRTKGVDADLADAVTEESVGEAVRFIREFARESGSLVVMTGAIDLISDGGPVYLVRNGDPLMAGITGSGCMLSALVTAFLAANREEPVAAAVAAVAMMGVAGERAAAKISERKEGNASFRNYLIDGIWGMEGAVLEAEAKTELIE